MKNKNHKKDNSQHVYQDEKIKNTISIRNLQWTPKQQEFIKLAENKDTKILLVSGPAGSSKTLLSTYVALKLINERRVSDIMYIRSAVESADSKLGYLPGEVNEKMAYYGIPFMDKLEELLPKNDIQSLLKDERINIQPVNFVRGQSWNARAVILDESQNMTQKELITILTRLGKFSKCFVLADPSQSDINGKSGGFVNIMKLFGDEGAKNQGVFTFEFTKEDIMRSELCKFLVERFESLKQ